MNRKWKFLSNEAGDALFVAIFAVVSVIGLAIAIPKITKMVEEQGHATRIRAIMSGVEQKARILAVQPGTYVGCVSFSGPSTCALNPTAFDTLKQTRVPGINCGAGPFCGVELTNLAFNPTTLVFSATVKYSGTDLKTADANILLEVPKEILQSQVFSCAVQDPTKPKFGGFDGSGNPICRALSPACGPGKFLSGINPVNLDGTCKDLPSMASCAGIGHFISRVEWEGGVDYEVECTERRDPYVLWPVTFPTPTAAPPPTLPTVAKVHIVEVLKDDLSGATLTFTGDYELDGMPVGDASGYVAKYKLKNPPGRPLTGSSGTFPNEEHEKDQIMAATGAELELKFDPTAGFKYRFKPGYLSQFSESAALTNPNVATALSTVKAVDFNLGKVFEPSGLGLSGNVTAVSKTAKYKFSLHHLTTWGDVEVPLGSIFLNTHWNHSDLGSGPGMHTCLNTCPGTCYCSIPAATVPRPGQAPFDPGYWVVNWSHPTAAWDNGFLLVQPDGKVYLLADSGTAVYGFSYETDSANRVISRAKTYSGQLFLDEICPLAATAAQGQGSTAPGCNEILKAAPNQVFPKGSVIVLYDDTMDMGGYIDLDKITANANSLINVTWTLTTY